MEEKIIEKIKKLLELTKSPNENEAKSAALKAQELMAKYEINLSQAQDSEKRKIVNKVYFHNNKREPKKWKYGLAAIVANNFMCKLYLYEKDIVFHGYEEDAEIALNTFKYLYDVGNKLASKYYHKCRDQGMPTRGVIETYLAGFKVGIKSVLEKQSMALMIITPKEVEDSFNKISAGGKEKQMAVHINSNKAFSDGIKAGKDSMSHKMLDASE